MSQVTACEACGKNVEDPDADLFWEYPDWPASCRLVCQDCQPHDDLTENSVSNLLRAARAQLDVPCHDQVLVRAALHDLEPPTTDVDSTWTSKDFLADAIGSLAWAVAAHEQGHPWSFHVHNAIEALARTLKAEHEESWKGGIS